MNVGAWPRASLRISSTEFRAVLAIPRDEVHQSARNSHIVLADPYSAHPAKGGLGCPHLCLAGVCFLGDCMHLSQLRR